MKWGKKLRHERVTVMNESMWKSERKMMWHRSVGGNISDRG